MHSLRRQVMDGLDVHTVWQDLGFVCLQFASRSWCWGMNKERWNSTASWLLG